MKHNYLVVIANTHYPPDHIESYVVSCDRQIVTAWDCTRLVQYMQNYICKERYVTILNTSYLGAEVNNTAVPELTDPNIKFDNIITFYDAVKLE